MATYWYQIDLDAAPDYEPWKPKSLVWARSINWAAVNSAALGLLDRIGPEGDLRAAARESQYSDVRAGLGALLYDPMDIDGGEIYNGGHRAMAMREQGQRYTLGYHLEAE